jgi:phage gp46-like protein
MSDIKTVWNTAAARGDYVVDSGDLASGNDLETAVLLSLTTDRLAEASDDTPDGDRRGWWADDAQNLFGSRLWLLQRAKGPMGVPQRAKDYAAEALQWLIKDGVVASFDITAEWVSRGQLDLKVVAKKQDGTVVATHLPQVWTD